MWFPVLVNSMLSVVAYVVTLRIIPRFKDMFVKADLYGVDMSKSRKEKMQVLCRSNNTIVPTYSYLLIQTLFIYSY